MNPEFTLTAGYNPWMADGGTDFDAAVTVSCETDGTAGAEVAEIIVIDRSGSMYGDKFEQAKKAAKAAIDVLTEGAFFAIVAGASEAVPQYPLDGTLARVTDKTRVAARRAVDRMSGGSSTDTGKWLRCAADVLATRRGVIGHVLLMTDGQVTQPERSYEADLVYCRGKFTCDSVGIGLDWDPDQLAHLAERFQGSFKFCENLDELPAYFTEVCGRTMSKAADEVELRVFAPEGTELAALWQMHPVKQDLLPHRRAIGKRGWAFGLAAWGSEEREYLLRMAFPPTDLTMRRNLRVEVWSGAERSAQERISVEWTEERSLFLAIDARVAALLGQSDLSERIGEALRALGIGDVETATQAVAQAYRLAEEGGFEAMMGTLSRLAEYDPVTKSVKLRSDIDRADELSATANRYVIESSRVVLSRKEERS